MLQERVSNPISLSDKMVGAGDAESPLELGQHSAPAFQTFNRLDMYAPTLFNRLPWFC